MRWWSHSSVMACLQSLAWSDQLPGLRRCRVRALLLVTWVTCVLLVSWSWQPLRPVSQDLALRPATDDNRIGTRTSTSAKVSQGPAHGTVLQTTQSSPARESSSASALPTERREPSTEPSPSGGPPSEPAGPAAAAPGNVTSAATSSPSTAPVPSPRSAAPLPAASAAVGSRPGSARPGRPAPLLPGRDARNPARSQQACPSRAAIAADSAGRLGNTMGEYATIYALGIRYNMTAVATPSLLRLMKGIFPNLSLPLVSDGCANRFRQLQVEEFERLGDAERSASSWKIVYYPHRARLFWRYRQLLRREFDIRSDLKRYAQDRLRTVARGRTDLTFVGVHVRRTDYAHHLKVLFNGELVTPSFYTSAMDLCRKRYPQPVFIVTSDDLAWCRRHLANEDAVDIHVLGDPSASSPGPERDMALLAACNHTIFDYGTFGFFGAFLAAGDIVLADGVGTVEGEMVAELRTGNISATYLTPDGRLLAKCTHCR